MVENKQQQDLLFITEHYPINFDEFSHFQKDERKPWGFTEYIQRPMPYKTKPILQRKRKSLDWDSKPLEKERKTKRNSPEKSLKRDRKKMDLETTIAKELMIGEPMEPLPFIPEVMSAADEVPWYEEDIDLLSDLFLNDIENVKPVSKELMKSRKSEDWGSKPQTFEFKKRAKWTKTEMRQLWECILRHGNNWTVIRDELTTRSYCQIKDKGRRCLFSLGWTTGRSKSETDESNLQAKRIAEEVLSKMR
mmetsp:Transcript_143042/g.202347  ORF Transcript_143042/g.202347 Transcript_143042/m.202347 type:complete len:249 (+) Transcript_143042:128-874(+)